MNNFASVLEILSFLRLEHYNSLFESMELDDFYGLNDLTLMNLGVEIRIHRVMIIDYIKSNIPSQSNRSETVTDISEVFFSQEHNDLIDISKKTSACFNLKAVSGYLDGLTFKVGESGAKIGRSAINEVVIPDSFVSRRHCKVEYDKDIRQFYLSDTKSTTGTYVKIRGKMRMYKDMMFQTGMSEFKVLNIVYLLTGVPSSIELVNYEGPTVMPIIFSKGGVIGRSRKSHISVPNDEEMSYEHAIIEEGNDGFYLRDLESKNSTWLRLSAEGEESEKYVIKEGDFIKVGFIMFFVQRGKSSKELQAFECCELCKEKEFEVYLMSCSHRACLECASKENNCLICAEKVTDYVFFHSKDRLTF